MVIIYDTMTGEADPIPEHAPIAVSADLLKVVLDCDAIIDPESPYEYKILSEGVSASGMKWAVIQGEGYTIFAHTH